jgi:uncharacterized membrane protein YfcA
VFALAPEILAALVALSFLGGAIVTSIGPGGILVVAGLYLLTSLSSAEVAGTASATFAVGAILGGAAFTRSGGIDWRVAGVVAAAAATGTRVGVRANPHLSRELYGLVLTALLAAVGCNVVYREYRDLEARIELAPSGRGLAGFAGIGLAIGLFSGLLGSAGRPSRRQRSYSSGFRCWRRSRSRRSSSRPPPCSRRRTTPFWTPSSPRWST